ncbi:MAG: peptidoglycan-binding protein [Gammaproteobacteria bacterium]|nr:peptidoglycan-binding protein [Gammaproteobacteria bacterium]
MRHSKIATAIGLVMVGMSVQAAPIDNTNTLPDAKPGECYAKVMVPAVYETKTEEVLVREASEKIDTIPAEYTWEEQKVIESPATTKLVPVPAEYTKVTEKIQISPRQVFWVNTLDRKGVPVSAVLLQGAKAGGVDLDEAIPGMCFREYYLPAQFKQETKEVLVKEGAESIDIVPAKYEWVEEQVLVKAATKKIEEVPVSYKEVTEQVLLEPAKTVWKKGNGLVEKIDNTTGEIMCLVEIPAVYKTITKRVVDTPATVKEIEVPAEYKTVKVRKLVAEAQEMREKTPENKQTFVQTVKVADPSFEWHATHSTDKPQGRYTGNQICLKEIPAKFEEYSKMVVKSAATVKKEEVPAEYKIVKVRKLLSAAEEKRTKIPAEYKTVTKRQKVGEERLEWRQVLCETNMTKDIVSRVQQKLKEAGYNPGAIDGVVGGGTLRAVDNYQREKNLPRGGLTLLTLDALGIKLSAN